MSTPSAQSERAVRSGWIDAALVASRPQAVGALLRYFRALSTAEDAFQEACLRALKSWPESGVPSNPAAWLIFVGRNVGLDEARRLQKQTALPEADQLEPQDDVEDALVERLDQAQARDDVLRLLFVCCHPELPASQQVALALRIVSGLSVPEIARAFLVSEVAMGQRITRAKQRIADASVPFETPTPEEQAERLVVVQAMIYLLFNEGYAASSGAQHIRLPLAQEAIRLSRLLLRLFPSEVEIMGLTALLLLHHARAPARLDAEGRIVLLADQDRGLWDGALIREGLGLVEKARRLGDLGPYQVQAGIAAAHVVARSAADTDWAEIDRLYAALETLQPSPVITLNRAVAVAKVRGAAAALAMIEPLEHKLASYFHFFGLQGGLLLELGERALARAALDRALALANTTAETEHIKLLLARLGEEPG